MFSGHETFSVAPNVVGSDLEGAVVLLDTRAGLYYQLSGAGAELWRHLAGPSTFDDLVESVTKRYSVSAQECAPDVARVLGDLLDRGLISMEA